jgi:tetratricopeptide (TPR) repeat protein
VTEQPSDPERQPSGLQRLIRELKRRHVFRVAGVYAVAAFVVLQAGDIIFPALDLPEQTMTLVVALVALGFPLAMVLAWAYQMTPDGVVRSAPSGAGETTLDPSQGRAPVALRLGLIGLVLGLVLVAGFFYLRSRDTSVEEVPISTDVVAIMPFSVVGSPESDYLSEGMVTLLSTKLDGAGELRTVDARALLGFVERSTGGTSDMKRAGQVAGRFGAGLFVLGDVVEAEGRIQITATMYETGGAAMEVSEGSAEGEADEIFDLVDEVASELLTGLSGGPGARVTRIATVTTSSLPALRAYLEGESALRRGQFEVAQAAFARAIAADSAFALAHYRLSVAAEWLTRKELAQEAAEQAFNHAGRLSDRDRRQLEAFREWRRGDADFAEDIYRTHVGTYPDDVEAWFQLGEVLFHYNPVRARPVSESAEAFRQVLKWEPDHATSLVHLARLLARQKELDELDSLVAEFVALSPEGDRQYEILALQAFAHGDPDAEQRTLDALGAAKDLSVILAIWDIALYTDNLDGAERLTEKLASLPRAVGVRTLAYSYLAFFKAARGKFREASRTLDRLAEVDPRGALEFRALLASLPFAPLDPPELRRLRDDVLAMDTTSVPIPTDVSTYFSIHNNLHGLLRPYLAGSLSVRLGDTTAALEFAAEIEAASFEGMVQSLATDLARGIRARVAQSGGRAEDALAILEANPNQVWYQMTIASPIYSQDIERFSRAELLNELGRYEEADAWYTNFVGTSPYEVAYVPMLELRRAQIAEQMGRNDDAVARYERFVDLWDDADPQLAGLVRDARDRLDALRSAAPAESP